MANFSWFAGGEWENCRCIPAQGSGMLSVVWNARFCRIHVNTVTSSLGEARGLGLTKLSDALMRSTRSALLALNLPILSSLPNTEGAIKFVDRSIGLKICSLLDSLVFPAGYPDTALPWQVSRHSSKKSKPKRNPRLPKLEREKSKCPQVALIRAVRHLLAYLTSGLHADWTTLWSSSFMHHSLKLKVLSDKPRLTLSEYSVPGRERRNRDFIGRVCRERLLGGLH